MKYSVRMVDQTGRACYLSHRGRSEWCKRVAARHLRDVSKDSRYTSFYVSFELEQA